MNDYYFIDNDDPLGQIPLNIKYENLQLKYFALLHITLTANAKFDKAHILSKYIESKYGGKWITELINQNNLINSQ